MKKMKKSRNKYLNVTKSAIIKIIHLSGAAGEKPIFFIDILKWFEKCGGEIYD